MRSLVLAVGLTVAFAGGALAQQVITGRAVPLQADQLIIEGTRVSIYGIDSPDPDQDRECTAGNRFFGCYANARREIEILIDQGPVTCTTTGETNYVGIPYANCLVNNINMGEHMVRTGLALAFRPQSDVYAEVEAAAKADQLGLWQPGIRFSVPWEWRDQNGRPLFGP